MRILFTRAASFRAGSLWQTQFYVYDVISSPGVADSRMYIIYIYIRAPDRTYVLRQAIFMSILYLCVLLFDHDHREDT